MNWVQLDLMKLIKDSQMYRQRAGGGRNWLKVRQHVPECNLIHYMSESPLREKRAFLNVFLKRNVVFSFLLV